MNETLRIVIADDHTTVREGLAMLVNAQADMEVVGEAADGRQAIEVAKRTHPDVVLMDISMPELNGLKAAATLKRLMPDIRIVTLTRHTDEAYLRELFQAGVSGYALKQSSMTQLMSAIRTVAAGGSYLDPAVTGAVFAGYAGRSHLRGDRSNTKLSPREEEVLHDIALGYSNREIAEKLDISVKTVESQKSAAMQKLQISTRREIIRYGILCGWMQQD